MSHSTISTSIDGKVATLQLNRPDALNALNAAMLAEVRPVIEAWDKDPDVRAIVITGGDKAFAAGADIKEMIDKTHLEALAENFLDDWYCIARCRTPTIAAVSGYALGGGCEIAMMCDVLLCADSARFGQPEITIGTIPGLGGTQRLTRRVGTAKAMELVLSGRMMDADEAERAGLVSRVVPAADLAAEAAKLAARIASFSGAAVQLAKACVHAAGSTTLDQGIALEQRAFHSLFGTDDQIEGMRAFAEKRKPEFKH